MLCTGLSAIPGSWTADAFEWPNRSKEKCLLPRDDILLVDVTLQNPSDLRSASSCSTERGLRPNLDYSLIALRAA